MNNKWRHDFSTQNSFKRFTVNASKTPCMLFLLNSIHPRWSEIRNTTDSYPAESVRWRPHSSTQQLYSSKQATRWQDVHFPFPTNCFINFIYRYFFLPNSNASSHLQHSSDQGDCRWTHRLLCHSPANHLFSSTQSRRSLKAMRWNMPLPFPSQPSGVQRLMQLPVHPQTKPETQHTQDSN